VIYRSPEPGNLERFLNHLENLLDTLNRNRRKVVICGDININTIDSKLRNRLVNVLKPYGFKLLDCGPTRTTSTTSSAIDHVMTNWDEVAFLQNLDPGLSDHYGQLTEIPAGRSAVPKHTSRPAQMKRRYDDEAIQNFTTDLALADWGGVYAGVSVDAKYSAFLSSFLLLFQKNFPKRSSYCKKAPKLKSWVTPSIKQDCVSKRKLSQMLRLSGRQDVKELLKKANKNLKTKIAQEKRNHFSQYIRNADNKQAATWKLVKTLTNKNLPINKPITLVVDDAEVTDDEVIAKLFNKHFLSIGDNANVPTDTTAECIDRLKNVLPNTSPIFEHPIITEQDIMEVLSKFAPKQSAGWDEIPMSLLKKCGAWIATPLVHVFNYSFYSGQFPEKMKFAVVKPIHKKGDKTECANYRPISLLTSFSKLLEKIMLNKLQEHLKSNSIMSEDQHGYRKGFSTTSATFQMINKVANAIDSKLQAGVILCDLSKAFDTVDHEILLEKLKFYGIIGATGSWMKSYLTGRKQCVQLKPQYRSDWETLTCGVPQGSILGPIQFSLLVNDLPAGVSARGTKRKIILFADDSSATVEAADMEGLKLELKTTLIDLSSWFDPNKLRMNHDKTQVMVFSPPGRQASPNPELDLKSIAGFLGLVIDHQLTWAPHIEQLVSKLTKASFAIRVLSRHCDTRTMRMVYFAQAQSLLQYGVIFWGAATRSIDAFKAQKRIIRYILAIGPRESCRPGFRALNILPLPCLYIQAVCQFTRDNLALFEDGSHHGHHTRQARELAHVYCRLRSTSNGVMQAGRRLYNKLPTDIRDCQDRAVFRRTLKKYLLDHSFYEIETFLNMN
jgi:Reverse transcriptase (RNA-dependent DNA polymerase)/Endonuclease-reverse transcriptase